MTYALFLSNEITARYTQSAEAERKLLCLFLRWRTVLVQLTLLAGSKGFLTKIGYNPFDPYRLRHEFCFRALQCCTNLCLGRRAEVSGSPTKALPWFKGPVGQTANKLHIGTLPGRLLYVVVMTKRLPLVSNT